jgi:hypothetical protein
MSASERIAEQSRLPFNTHHPIINWRPGVWYLLPLVSRMEFSLCNEMYLKRLTSHINRENRWKKYVISSWIMGPKKLSRKKSLPRPGYLSQYPITTHTIPG